MLVSFDLFVLCYVVLVNTKFVCLHLFKLLAICLCLTPRYFACLPFANLL
jgi:hypothetical protein